LTVHNKTHNTTDSACWNSWQADIKSYTSSKQVAPSWRCLPNYARWIRTKGVQWFFKGNLC